jgi:hypothetical protein
MRELFNLDDNGRGGDRRDERPDSVATLLSEKETVGYQEGSELANVGYSSYPQDQESLYLPNTTMVLQSIINCEKVRDQHDLANELGITHSTMLSDAVEFHGFSNFPESVDHTPSPIIQAPDGDGGTVEIDKDEWPSFRIGYHLYLTLGMSASEIAELLGDYTEREITNELRKFGFL